MNAKNPPKSELAARVAIVTRSLADTPEGRAAKQLVESLDSEQSCLVYDAASDWRTQVSLQNIFPCDLSNRCGLDSLSALGDKLQMEVYHIMCSKPFFAPKEFAAFVAREQNKGRQVVAEIRQPQVIDADLARCLQTVNSVLAVDIACENELLAYGVPAAKILRVGCALPLTFSSDSNAPTLEGLGISRETSFTLVSVSLPIGEVVDQLIKKADTFAGTMVFCPIATLRCQASESHVLREWESVARDSLANRNILWINRIPSFEETALLVAGCSALVFTAGSPCEETSELLSLAFANGKPVVAPEEYPFSHHSERIFLYSSRIPAFAAVASITSRPELRARLGAAAKKWTQSQRYADYVAALCEFYKKLRETTVAPMSVKQAPAFSAPARRENTTAGTALRAPRILMQNRSNAYTQPGGDTVVMDRVTEGLRKRGIEVAIDLEGAKDPRGYDLVHLFNFALKDQTEQLARNCQRAGVPFVVTTMYEDWPIFFHQMTASFQALRAYVDGGQNRTQWAELSRQAKLVPPSAIWDNSVTANLASALITTGESEARALKRDYPSTKRVEIYHCGADFSERRDGGELFTAQTGLRDFVLCVGRFELRKNQLMLLKAFEDSDMTLVFAGGGFSYQPEYLETCKRFQRKGKTIFLDRLEPEMLASAFQAARVHVLPSWLELPGIVSLEAASFGRNVVVTDYGTARDYFGNFGFYCSPDSPESIYNATMAAYHAPVNPELIEQVRKFTWDAAAERNAEIYRKVLAERNDLNWGDSQKTTSPLVPSSDTPRDPRLEQTIQMATFNARRALHSVGMIPAVVGEEMDDPKQTQEALRLCEEGDQFAAQRELDRALGCYQRAISAAPRFARAFRSCGAIVLAEGDAQEAERYFERALSVDPNESRALIGLSMLKWERGAKEEAYEDCLRANRLSPEDGMTILQLVRMSYELERLKELEEALRGYLKSDPENVEMLYCLAGCSYKRKRHFLARGVIERILRIRPDHEGALELRDRIAAEVAGDDPEEDSLDSVGGAGVRVSITGRDLIANRLQSLETAKKNREYEEALAIAAEILESDELHEAQRCQASLLQAEVSALRGDLKFAEEVFRRYLHHANWGYRAHAGLGAVCAERNSWLEAEDLFDRAVKLVPTCDAAIAGKGVCAQQAGRSEDAWQLFEKALNVNPENLRAVYGMVQLGYQLQRLHRTAEVLEAYLEMHPVDLSMMYTYAGCCYALGRLDRAEEELRKVMIFDPEHALARELLDKIDADRRLGRANP